MISLTNRNAYITDHSLQFRLSLDACKQSIYSLTLSRHREVKFSESFIRSWRPPRCLLVFFYICLWLCLCSRSLVKTNHRHAPRLHIVKERVRACMEVYEGGEHVRNFCGFSNPLRKLATRSHLNKPGIKRYEIKA